MSDRLDADSELPPGLSAKEEARWWDEHRDYWNKVQSPIEVVGPSEVRRTKPINLRLPVAMIDALKQQARRRALPYQTLVRMWLQERLSSEGVQKEGTR